MSGEKVLELIKKCTIRENTSKLPLRKTQDVSQVRNKRTKAWYLIAMTLVSGLLMACGDGKSVDVNNEKSTVQSASVEEKTEGSEMMEDSSRELVKQALSCGDREANRVMEGLTDAKLGFPLSKVERMEDSKNDLRIIDSESVEYSVMVNKQFYVDEIKNVQTGEIIFEVYE